MNIITGLPRSGSTLFCNILNQNPAFYANSTSLIPQFCNVLVNSWTNSPEIKGYIKEDRDGTEKKIINSLRAFCDTWNDVGDKRKIIFDKSRGWLYNMLLLRALYPNSKAIVIVRDLRDVFASVEKQHRKTAIFDEASNISLKTIAGRAELMFNNDGLIGGPLVGINDIINRNLNVFWLRYEDLISNPYETLLLVYKYLGQPYFEHDLNNIENTATDPDWIYSFKFPHEGSGKLKIVSKEEKEVNKEYLKYMGPAVSEVIKNKHEWFYNYFQYK